MSARKLSVVAASLHADLAEMGFGTDTEISGADLVELMSSYFEKLDECVAIATARPAQQEALPLN